MTPLICGFLAVFFLGCVLLYKYRNNTLILDDGGGFNAVSGVSILLFATFLLGCAAGFAIDTVGGIQDRIHKRQTVHVLDLGVVDRIETWGSGKYGNGKYRTVDFRRTSSVDGDYKYYHQIDDSPRLSLTDNVKFARIKKQFVAGKEYIVTFRKEYSDFVLVSFYPKN